MNTDPKELTCIGGLLHELNDLEFIDSTIYLGTTTEEENSIFEHLQYRDLLVLSKPKAKVDLQGTLNYYDLTEDQKAFISYKVREEVVKNVLDFIDLMENIIGGEINFRKEFGIVYPVRLSEVFEEEKVQKNLYEGITNMRNIGAEEDERINQTLFFLPIIAGILDLNERLYDLKD